MQAAVIALAYHYGNAAVRAVQPVTAVGDPAARLGRLPRQCRQATAPAPKDLVNTAGPLLALRGPAGDACVTRVACQCWDPCVHPARFRAARHGPCRGQIGMAKHFQLSAVRGGRGSRRAPVPYADPAKDWTSCSDGPANARLSLTVSLLIRRTTAMSWISVSESGPSSATSLNTTCL